MKKTLQNIVLAINVLAAFSLFFSYVSVFIPPDKWWIPSLFGLAYPFFLAVNLFFIVFWLLFKPRFVVISLLLIFSGWGFLSRYFQLNERGIERSDMKVVSYNVQHFFGDGSKSQPENAQTIIHFLKEQNADIYCLQEVRLRKNSIFNLQNTVKELPSVNHYQYARSSTTHGSVTMTRFPIVNMGEIRFKGSRNITIYTDVLVQADTVRIFNIHLQSYQ
ncbi:MAG: hypothetical protein J7L95_07270, partial [Prolixibacteraceae bacterium]|nr:hypothetical protein [Prolixibacteraceae bacterium]